MQMNQITFTWLIIQDWMTFCGWCVMITISRGYNVHILIPEYSRLCLTIIFLKINRCLLPCVNSFLNH